MNEMKRISLAIFLWGLVFITAEAQISIKGRVIDSLDGLPMIGVSVLQKGTTNGVTTDLNGNFSLQIKKEFSPVLNFSYIGYSTKEINVLGLKEIQVTMNSSINELQEVVAVGYGNIKKRDLTGSVSTVKSENLSRTQSANIASALVGQTSGLIITSPQGHGPGSSPNIIIRGENSISGNNNPLWVIDGYTRSGGANSVNPEDIESVEVLKDASATAIYGSRGAGGVIIVTTKKGLKSTKPVLELTANFGVETIVNEPNLMQGSDYYKYWNNSGIVYFDKNIDPNGNYDWCKEITRQALQQNYFLSIYGGTDNVNYKITADYFNQDGVIKYNNDYQRMNVRSVLDVKLNKYIKVGLTVYGERAWINNGAGGGTYQQAVEMSPLIPIYNSDGSFNHNLNEKDLSVLSNNFIESVKLQKSKSESNSINSQAYLSVEPIKGLIFKTSEAINYNTNKNQSFSPKELDLVNGMNSASANEKQGNSYEWINTLSFIKDFSKKHSINAVLGYTLESDENYSVGSSGKDFISDSYEYWAIGSGPVYELPAPDPLIAGKATIPIIRNSGSSGYSESALMSFLGRINYVFNDKYLITLTGRYDGASQLADGHKWAFFPSMALGWRAYEESFIKNLNVFSNLKFRVSTGRTGSQGIGNYSTLGLTTNDPTGGKLYVNTFNTNSKFYTLSVNNSLPNPLLTWEKTDQTNIGMDVGFIDNRLRLSTDYYYKYTFDMFVTKNLPAESGYGSYLTNAGEMSNKGLEIELSGDPIVSKDWKISSSMNLTLNRNMILSLGGPDYMLYTNKNSYGGLLSYNIVGKPVSLIYGWKYDGIWQNENDIKYGAVVSEAGASRTIPGDMRYKDINNDGKIDESDKVQIMDPNPKLIMGWNGNISYKNINFSFLFSGMFGQQIYNYTKKNLFNKLAFRSNFWTPESNIQNQPTAGNQNIGDSDYFVEDGSFVRLRNLTISYNIPKSLLKTIGVNNFEIYCSGNDLLTITGYSGYNPEVSRNGNSESYRGIDYNSYPATTSVFVGVKTSF